MRSIESTDRTTNFARSESDDCARKSSAVDPIPFSGLACEALSALADARDFAPRPRLASEAAKGVIATRAPFVSRRTFLAMAGACVAAAATGKETFADVPAAGNAESFCTFGFGTYGMKSLKAERAVEVVAKAGFDSIMIACMPGWDSDPIKLSPERRVALRKQLDDSGLKLSALTHDLHPSDSEKTRSGNRDSLKAAAALAHDLCPNKRLIIETMLAGKEDWEKAKPLFLRNVGDWAKICQDEGVTLAIKPHRGTSMSKPEQAIELIVALGNPPSVRMCYDYSHFAFRDMPMEDTIRTSLPFTAFVTIKDVAMENGKAVFKLPGDTKAIDYAAMFRQFYQGGYRGDFNCEVSTMVWSKPGYDPEQAAQRCYANIAPAFIAAGVPRPKRG